MSSQPEEDDVAGPSGLSRHESLQLLGLTMSDDDEDYNDLMDQLERQHAFQTHLLEQSGGGLDTNEEGAFDFELQRFVDRKSDRMGVQERHFKTQLRQRGTLIPGQNITQALQDGLRRAVDQVLTTTPDLHDQDRLYFTIASDRLHNNFQGWGLRAGEWRRDTERVEALFQRLAQALNSNEQFEMDDSFQVSITQVHHAPQGTGKPRRGKPGHPTMDLLRKIPNPSSGLPTTINSVVPEPLWSPKLAWTNTRNGHPFVREGKFKGNSRCGSMTKLASLQVLAATMP